jgi:alpha-ketoglutarate-dependent taurine dioxygenase
MPSGLGKQEERDVDIRRLTDHAGAEAVGIDLTQTVSSDIKAALNRAFVEHSVLVIRDQTLNPAQVLGAVEMFRIGIPPAQHALRDPGVPADPLHFQPGPLPRRYALHPRRGLAHGPLKRHAAAKSDGTACGDAAQTGVATRSSPTWQRPTLPCPWRCKTGSPA